MEMLPPLTTPPSSAAVSRILTILAQIQSVGQEAQAELVGLLREELLRVCQTHHANGKRYFPISILRETCRKHFKQLALPSVQKLPFYLAVSEALLSVMAVEPSADAPRIANALLSLLADLEARNPAKALLLRLQYVVGLNWDEICELPGAAAKIDDPVLCALELVADLKAAGVVQELLEKQNLGPKGEITYRLQDVRDGDGRLDDLVAGNQKRLRGQAAFLLSQERGKSSLQVTDLVNEIFLRLPQDSTKAPLNHWELDALVKLLMRHILADRFRKKVPGQPKLSGELPADLSAPSQLLDNQLFFEKVLSATNDVIQELRQTNPESAEILQAVLFHSADQKELARLHSISLANVKRRIKDGRERIRERLGLE